MSMNKFENVQRAISVALGVSPSEPEYNHTSPKITILSGDQSVAMVATGNKKKYLYPFDFYEGDFPGIKKNKTGLSPFNPLLISQCIDVFTEMGCEMVYMREHGKGKPIELYNFDRDFIIFVAPVVPIQEEE